MQQINIYKFQRNDYMIAKLEKQMIIEESDVHLWAFGQCTADKNMSKKKKH